MEADNGLTFPRAPGAVSMSHGPRYAPSVRGPTGKIRPGCAATSVFAAHAVATRFAGNLWTFTTGHAASPTKLHVASLIAATELINSQLLMS